MSISFHKQATTSIIPDTLRLKQRNDIRKAMRQHRKKITQYGQKAAASALRNIVLCHPALAAATRIALFLPFDGEINTMPLIRALWTNKKQVYLPIIHPFNTKELLFQRYLPTSQLIVSAFDILTPPLDVRQIIPSHQLDLLFIPLVAFDRHGYRLGMGGGYYDRMLGYYHTFPFIPIGMAYHSQEINEIPILNWDIPLPEIITDKARIICHND